MHVGYEVALQAAGQTVRPVYRPGALITGAGRINYNVGLIACGADAVMMRDANQQGMGYKTEQNGRRCAGFYSGCYGSI